MRIAVIGLGGIARKAYFPVLAARADLELLLHARSASRIEELRQQYRIGWGSTHLDEVISARPDAAFVLTPNGTHTEIATRLLDAGIDTYLEKPATLRASETHTLAELAERKDRVLMVGFNRRFAPLHVRARQLVGDGPVNVAIFQKNRTHGYHPDLANQLYDDTIHQVDLVRFFCGEGRVVSTVQQSVAGHLQGTTGVIALQQGGMAVVTTSLQAGRWSETYEIQGNQQSIRIEAFARLDQTTLQEEKVWQETYASSWTTTLDGRGFTAEIDHFLDCVRTRRQPSTSAWDSVKTQLLVEEMIAAAR
jgi:virulence factor